MFQKKLILLTLVLLCVYYYLSSYRKNHPSYTQNIKVRFDIKGINVVSMPYIMDTSHVQEIQNISCNWVAQIPFAFCKPNSPDLIFDHPRMWTGETTKGTIYSSSLLKKNNIHIMLKPQIWNMGEFTGHFTLHTEKEWNIWEQNYYKYIINFVRIADSLHIEMFCIGNELEMAVKKREHFWNKLIDSIRTLYNGKLIYAANWDEYTTVPFWNKLDYIGINAYFPLSNSHTPSVANLTNAWKKYLTELEKFSASQNKKIIFTEIGYKSVDSTAFQPWNPTSHSLNLKAQENAYNAFLLSFYDKKWFQGCFFWKWYPQNNHSYEKYDTDYTPQNKPTQKIIKQAFSLQ